MRTRAVYRSRHDTPLASTLPPRKAVAIVLQLDEAISTLNAEIVYPSPYRKFADLLFNHELAEARMPGIFVDHGRLFSYISPRG